MFGRWKVLGQDPNDSKRVLCRCSCGVERSVVYTELTRGKSQSCGCLAKELVSERNVNSKTNLVGQTVGRWTVLKNDPDKEKYYLCKCSCGSEKSVSHANLRNGRSTSCGCGTREGASKKAKELRGIDETELIGKKIGRWTVVSVEGKDGYKQWAYRVRCECGNEDIISRVSLISGKSKSCGCLNSELTSIRTTKRHQENGLELIGQKFGKLTIKEKTNEKLSDGRYGFICLCDCGKEIILPKNNVTSGRTSSCGCEKSRVMKDRHKEYRVSKGFDPEIFIGTEYVNVRNKIVAPINKIVRLLDCDTCANCGNYIDYMEVHHIIPIHLFWDISDKDTYKGIYDLLNLCCLCPSCHGLAHEGGTKKINEEMQGSLLEYASNRAVSKRMLDKYNEVVNGKILSFIEEYILTKNSDKNQDPQ